MIVASLMYTLCLGVLLTIKTYLLPYLKKMLQNAGHTNGYDRNLPLEQLATQHHDPCQEGV